MDKSRTSLLVRLRRRGRLSPYTHQTTVQDALWRSSTYTRLTFSTPIRKESSSSPVLPPPSISPNLKGVTFWPIIPSQPSSASPSSTSNSFTALGMSSTLLRVPPPPFYPISPSSLSKLSRIHNLPPPDLGQLFFFLAYLWKELWIQQTHRLLLKYSPTY